MVRCVMHKDRNTYGRWGGGGGFFFNDTATTVIYTLSLHAALPISVLRALASPPSEAERAAGMWLSAPFLRGALLAGGEIGRAHV